MTHAPVSNSFSRLFLACIAALVFAAVAPAAFAQRGASHGGASHASMGGGAGHASVGGGHLGGGSRGSSGGGFRGASSGARGGPYAEMSGSTGSAPVHVGGHLLQRPGGGSNGYHGSGGPYAGFSGGAAMRGSPAHGNSASARGFTRMIFEAPVRSGELNSAGVAQGAHIMTLGTQRPRVILHATGPVRYELVRGEWRVVANDARDGLAAARPAALNEAQNGRPGYVPPQQVQRPVTPPRPVAQAQAPRPIMPPQPPQMPRPIVVPPMPPMMHTPIPGPVTQPGPIHFPMQPPIRYPAPVIGQPGLHPIPILHLPLGPVAAPRPIILPQQRLPKAPLFHPVIAPPLRRLFDANGRVGGPFAEMSPETLHFNAHPCFETIGNCGLGSNFGFDGDFDFDDGFPFGFGFGFGFPFGSPFFFGPFGFPAFGFGFGFGPNCFFNGVFEPCSFTPWGFAQFQAFAPGGWGWSYLGLGNGYFYSPPEEPPAAPWNAIETAPSVNLQNFTSEYYMPAPAPLPVPYSEPQAGTQQNPVTEIVTTDGIVFGVTSYWMENNQLCYVTTYNVKHCIGMSRVDLQKTVDMNYKRGVKFTLTPKPSKKSQ